jgi:hypothetical protein
MPSYMTDLLLYHPMDLSGSLERILSLAVL